MLPAYSQLFRMLLPEAALLLGALLVLSVDLFASSGRTMAARLRMAVLLGAGAVVAAIGLVVVGGRPGLVYEGVFVVDALAAATRFGVLGLTLLTLGVATGSTPLRSPGEYVAIILFAATGFTLMAAAQQLLVAFLALELASLSLYVLTAFEPEGRRSPEAAEAALKYYLFGGMAAAFLLFGFSILYGLTGSLQLARISAVIADIGLSPLLGVALVMILVAFGFKAAAAPFHAWAPDAYQGAPAPSAALIASASKLAGFTLFARLLWPGLGGVAGDVSTAGGAPGWLPLVALLAGLSIILGNLAALAQSSVRRILAYSAIAHAGGLLLGVIAAHEAGAGPLYYYAATYGIATVGTFGVIAVVEQGGAGGRLEGLAGLQRRSPFLAGCLLVFILSLAGIPPLAGFFGKFAVFAAALKLGGVGGPAGWLAILAILFSAVGLYYYLLILKQAFVADGEEGRIRTPPLTGLALTTAVVLLLALGLFPSLVLSRL